MVRAIAPDADRLDRRFQMVLRQCGYDPAQVRALLAITPAAAARLRSLSRFLEQVDYTGRRLAKLNVPPAVITEQLGRFDQLLDPVLKGRFQPAREQFHLVTQFALQAAFYRERESESQTFFGLFEAEVEATGLDDLLHRFLLVLVKSLGAAAGRLLFEKDRFGPELAGPLYIVRGQAKELLIGDPSLRGRYASYWSYPFGPSVVLQLCFSTPYPWLPRERELLAVAAARCREAIERVQMSREIRRLEAASYSIEKEERRRIGRDLHDDVGQALAFLRLELEMLEREVPERLRARLGESRELAGRTATALRRVVAALSPSVLDRLGLAVALRHLAARFRRLHGLDLRLRISLDSQPLSKPMEEALYHIAQECLQNIAKHSRATRVNLWLRSADKRIKLSVTDNGAGFCADKTCTKPNSFGLAGMRERAALLGGKFAIRSAPGKGTQVSLEFPIGAATVVSNGKNSRTLN